MRPDVRIVVGLGNPGEDYERTRHNIGFRVVEELLGRHGRPYQERRARSLLGRMRIEERPVLVARPQTFMNRSGASVRALLDHAEAGPEHLLVVCDDFHLDVGTLRVRSAGGPGGHNGLLSIIETLETESFARLRLGVGPVHPGVPHADFVLGRFARREEAQLPEVIGRAADCVERVVALGVTAAMNEFNRPRAGAAGNTD